MKKNIIYFNVLNNKSFKTVLDSKNIKISASNLQGNSPNVATNVTTIGGVLFNPILGNMLRTYHAVPQVIFCFKKFE